MSRKRSPAVRHYVSGAAPDWRPRGDDGAPDPPLASEEAPDASHAVYFLTGPDLQLLYVGQTSRLMERLRQHAIDKPWFDTTCRVFVEWYRRPEDARLRETNAIWSSRPEHNRMIAKPSAPAPDPDVPLRPLIDMTRDLTGLCRNCTMANQRTGGLCGTCYKYRQRTGHDRPAHLYKRYA